MLSLVAILARPKLLLMPLSAFCNFNASISYSRLNVAGDNEGGDAIYLVRASDPEPMHLSKSKQLKTDTHFYFFALIVSLDF